MSPSIRLHRARAGARLSTDGSLVVLAAQDRSLWDRPAIEAAGTLLVSALRLGRPGPFQLQAAIAACHAEAPSWAETDWDQIALLYEKLVELAPSPVVRLNRAIALSHVLGPEAALREVEALIPRLDRYHLLHATRAELLRRVGRAAEALAADGRALELTRNPAERALLSERLVAQNARARYGRFTHYFMEESDGSLRRIPGDSGLAGEGVADLVGHLDLASLEPGHGGGQPGSSSGTGSGRHHADEIRGQASDHDH